MNGIHKGVAFQIPPPLIGSVLFPAFVMKNVAASFNFGSAAFQHAPSSDFSSLVHGDNAHVISANAKEAFVTAGQHRPLALILEPARDLAEQVRFHFTIVLYLFFPVYIAFFRLNWD